jgi:hypothetical protein
MPAINLQRWQGEYPQGAQVNSPLHGILKQRSGAALVAPPQRFYDTR